MSPVLPKDIVARIKDETDIVALVGEYVQLKPAGTAFKGLCPFHRDSNPSLHVNPQRQIYKCFACGEGGDAISFLMKLQGMSFPEALEILARPLNIDLSRFLVENDESEGERQAFFRANEAAAEIWSEALWDDDGAEARDYLLERGFSEEILRRFDVGFASGNGADFARRLADAGVSEDLGLRCGLLGVKDGGRSFAYFRRRIIFPIRNIAQRIAGFGGRIIGQGEPKYLNSQESTYFTKRQLLYGFSASRIAVARSKTAILVEGYLDLIALAQSGFNNVVATCGTAFTTEQSRALRRGCRTLYILFDGDKAGLKAAVKSSGTALAAGLEPKVARLPQGEDPASFLQTSDRDGMTQVLEDALSYLPLLSALTDESGKGREGRERALRTAAQTIAGIDDPIRRACLETEAAEIFGVEEAVLKSETSRILDTQNRRAAHAAARDQDVAGGTTQPAAEPGGVTRSREVDQIRAEAKVFAHALADDSGQAADLLLDLWGDRTFAAGNAELLRSELMLWREDRDGGGQSTPAAFIEQRWHEAPEPYRHFVSSLLTDEEAIASGSQKTFIRETYARIVEIEKRRRGVDALRAWTGDRGE